MEPRPIDKSFSERNATGDYGLMRFCPNCGWKEHVRYNKPIIGRKCTCCSTLFETKPATKKEFERYDTSMKWQDEVKRWRKHVGDWNDKHPSKPSVVKKTARPVVDW